MTDFSPHVCMICVTAREGESKCERVLLATNEQTTEFTNGQTDLLYRGN